LTIAIARLGETKQLAIASYYTFSGRTMPQSTHNRLAELHNLTEHTHDGAAHDKADHLTPHELTKQADEHSEKMHERTNVLPVEVTKRNEA
jgi:hypothetical protein